MPFRDLFQWKQTEADNSAGGEFPPNVPVEDTPTLLRGMQASIARWFRDTLSGIPTSSTTDPSQVPAQTAGLVYHVNCPTIEDTPADGEHPVVRFRTNAASRAEQRLWAYPRTKGTDGVQGFLCWPDGTAVAEGEIAENVIVSAIWGHDEREGGKCWTITDPHKASTGHAIAAAISAASLAGSGVTAGGIGTAQLADMAVTDVKLADGAVREAKILDRHVTRNKLAIDAVGTLEIEDGSVTQAKLASGIQIEGGGGGGDPLYRFVTPDQIVLPHPANREGHSFRVMRFTPDPPLTDLAFGQRIGFIVPSGLSVNTKSSGPIPNTITDRIYSRVNVSGLDASVFESNAGYLATARSHTSNSPECFEWQLENYEGCYMEIVWTRHDRAGATIRAGQSDSSDTGVWAVSVVPQRLTEFGPGQIIQSSGQSEGPGGDVDDAVGNTELPLTTGSELQLFVPPNLVTERIDGVELILDGTTALRIGTILSFEWPFEQPYQASQFTLTLKPDATGAELPVSAVLDDFASIPHNAFVEFVLTLDVSSPTPRSEFYLLKVATDKRPQGYVPNWARIRTGEAVADTHIPADRIADGSISGVKLNNVDARNLIRGEVADWAEQGNTDDIPAAKIGGGDITETKIHPGAVTESKILAGAVTTEKIAGDAITADKIADDAVRTEHIAHGAVTEANIAPSQRNHVRFIPSTSITFLNDGSGQTPRIELTDPALDHLGAGDVIAFKWPDAFEVTDAVTQFWIGRRTSSAGVYSILFAEPTDYRDLNATESKRYVQFVWEPVSNADQHNANHPLHGHSQYWRRIDPVLLDGEVTTAKLADSAVTADKLVPEQRSRMHFAGDTEVRAIVSTNQNEEGGPLPRMEITSPAMAGVGTGHVVAFQWPVGAGALEALSTFMLRVRTAQGSTWHGAVTEPGDYSDLAGPGRFVAFVSELVGGVPADHPLHGQVRYWRRLHKPFPEITQISAGAVGTPEIADAAVTKPKLAPDERMPVGTIIMWGGDPPNIPEGWLECDGRTLNVVDHPELHGVIGTTFGPDDATGDSHPHGPGHIQFKLPNFRQYLTHRVPSGPNSSNQIGYEPNNGWEHRDIGTSQNAIRLIKLRFLIKER